MALKLTDRQLRSAGIGQTLADTVVPGLRFSVGKASRTFWYRLRTPEGRLKRVTIGAYASEAPRKTLEEAERARRFTLEQARQACRALKDVRATGDDPRAYQRRRTGQAVPEKAPGAYTVADLCAEYLALKERQWRPTTRREITRCINVEVLPRWSSKPLRALTKSDIRDAQRAIYGSGAGVMSNRFLSLMKTLLDFACEEDKLDGNPASVIKRLHDERKARLLNKSAFLTKRELAVLMRGLPGAGLRKDYRDAVHLILLTGVRASEALGSHAREVEEGTWTIPGERSKNLLAHKVMLSRQAATLLQRRMETHPGHLFPKTRYGRGDAAKPATLQSNDLGAHVRVLVQRLDMAPWSAHSLRRSMSTHLGEMGYPPEITDERLLNHRPGGVRQRYDFAQRDEQARKAWQAWADFLDALAQPNVLAMPEA